MSFTIEIDTTRFQIRASSFITIFRQEMNRVATLLKEAAERDAQHLISILIYDTPERSGYARTGDLRNSIRSSVTPAGTDKWLITVGAGDGIDYAIYNELGTLEAHRSFDEIIATAKSTAGDLIILEYGQPSRGLEPRPWVIPSIVGVSRRAPPFIIQAVRTTAGRTFPR